MPLPNLPVLPRIHIDLPLTNGLELDLPPGPARHVQVLRLQPGAPITLFDGRGGEWQAEVLKMGRSDVQVRLGAHSDLQRELGVAVTLALGMPANERMDTLIEKATELGVAAIQPLLCERSVLRLADERAARKVAHWQGVAAAASEQSGRTRVPRIEPVRKLNDWLDELPEDTAPPPSKRLLLSLQPGAGALSALLPWTDGPHDESGALLCLSGPEGGLSAAEESAARRRGFEAVRLGPRVLRADTAPLALLAFLALRAEGGA